MYFWSFSKASWAEQIVIWLSWVGPEWRFKEGGGLFLGFVKQTNCTKAHLHQLLYYKQLVTLNYKYLRYYTTGILEIYSPPKWQNMSASLSTSGKKVMLISMIDWNDFRAKIGYLLSVLCDIVGSKSADNPISEQIKFLFGFKSAQINYTRSKGQPGSRNIDHFVLFPAQCS